MTPTAVPSMPAKASTLLLNCRSRRRSGPSRLICSLANQTGDTLRACDPCLPLVPAMEKVARTADKVHSCRKTRARNASYRTEDRGVRISSPRQRGERTPKLGPRTRIGWRIVCAVCPAVLGGLEVRIHLSPGERWYGAGGEKMAPSSLQPTDGVP